MKYSVIIPTKNNPDQVQRCLDSIPSDSEIEILVCDDCSDPEFLTQIREICGRKMNVALFESNRPAWAGRARNIGIEKAQGEWLIFSDSDDFFDTHFWRNINSITTQSEADIIYFCVKGVYSDTLEPAARGVVYNNYVEGFLDSKKNAEERLRFYHMVPWGKIFRKSFIDEKQIRYDEVRASNDVMFNVKAGNLAKSIEAHRILMYYVTVSNNSLTKVKSKEVLHCRFDVLVNHYKYVMALGKPQCAYNFFKLVYKYSKPYGFTEFLWYCKQMIKYRVNPFVIISKINRYEQ